MNSNYVVATNVINRRLANMGVFIPFVYRAAIGHDTEITVFTSHNREVLEEFLADTTSICLISEVDSLAALPKMQSVLEDYAMYTRKKRVKDGATFFADNTIFQFLEDSADPKIWVRPDLEIKQEVENFEAAWKDCLAKLKQGKCYFAFPLPISSKAAFSKGYGLKSIKDYTGISDRHVMISNTTAKSYSNLMGSWDQLFRCSNSEFVSFKEVEEEIVLTYSPCLAKCPKFMGYYNDQCELGSFTCIYSRLEVEEPELLTGVY